MPNRLTSEEQAYVHFSGSPLRRILDYFVYAGPESALNPLPFRLYGYDDLFDITEESLLKIGRTCGFRGPGEPFDSLSYGAFSGHGPAIYKKPNGAWVYALAERGVEFRVIAESLSLEEIERVYVQDRVRALRGLFLAYKGDEGQGAMP